MARFDVYRLPGTAVRYVVDVQAEFLSHLTTRAIIPLFPEGSLARASLQLNPILDFENARYVVFTQLIVAVALNDLKRRVGSLAEHQDDITRALDILLTGF